jgi:hypothetical protein
MKKIGVFIIIGCAVVLSGCGYGNEWARAFVGITSGYSQGVSEANKQQQEAYRQQLQYQINNPAPVYHIYPDGSGGYIAQPR